MPGLRTFLCSTALALVVSAPAALADLTAAEAWGDWRDYMQGMGYTLDATETADGGSLTVSDITISMLLEDDKGSMNVSLGQLTFVENGDGSVDVVFPATVPIKLELQPADDKRNATFDLSYAHTGMKMTMSGSVNDLTYVTAADTVRVTLDGAKVDGKEYGAETAQFSMDINDLASKSTMKIGGLRNYHQEMSTGTVKYVLAVNPPEDEGKFDLVGQMEQISFAGGGDIPLDIATAASMQAMLDSGFAFSGDFSFGAGSLNLKTVDPKNTLDFTNSSDGGSLGVSMGSDGLAYEGTQKNVSLSAQVSGLPFPIALSMAESGFGLKMPVAKSDVAQDFAFAMNLTQFSMSDMIWGIFDPAGQLPRDPATIDLDVSGKAKLLFDLMDPKSAEAMQAPGAQPGEVEALTINRIIVDAVGAKLTGSGDIMFDNTDKETFPGMAKPVGGIDLSLLGGNALIDKLVAMGIVQQEQAMGARMMMGLFAVPGDGPDSLKSKIEFTVDGQVLANGQRIK